MTDRPPPRVLAVFTGPISRTWLVASCPLCLGQHEHPAGPAGSDERRTLGHRPAPCNPTAGYVMFARLPVQDTRSVPTGYGDRLKTHTTPTEPTRSVPTAPGPSTKPTDKQIVSDLLYNNYSDWKDT